MFWYNVKGYYSKIDFRHCFAQKKRIVICTSKELLVCDMSLLYIGMLVCVVLGSLF